MANIGKQFAVKGLNKRGEGLIQIYINFTRTSRKVISKGVYIEPRYWDKENSIILDHPLASQYNYLIDSLAYTLSEIQKSCIEKNIDFSPEIIDDSLDKEKPNRLFNKFYKTELENSTSAPGTYKDQLKTLNHLNTFNPKIKFLDLNKDLIINLDKYFHKLGLAQVTINCHHKNIKKYINLAIKHGYFLNDIKKHPYSGIKLPKPKAVRTFLTLEKIRLIYLAQYQTDRLRRVADRFVFACCTGLKVSDLSRVTPDKFDGELLKIEPERISKTSGYSVSLPIKIMFNGLPFQILQKYGFSLPRFTDENYNKLLKTVAAQANVPPLVSQTARHTFLTLIAHSTGKIFKVMKYGGIASSETASVYIRMSKDYKGKLNIDDI